MSRYSVQLNRSQEKRIKRELKGASYCVRDEEDARGSQRASKKKVTDARKKERTCATGNGKLWYALRLHSCSVCKYTIVYSRHKQDEVESEKKKEISVDDLISWFLQFSQHPLFPFRLLLGEIFKMLSWTVNDARYRFVMEQNYDKLLCIMYF